MRYLIALLASLACAPAFAQTFLCTTSSSGMECVVAPAETAAAPDIWFDPDCLPFSIASPDQVLIFSPGQVFVVEHCATGDVTWRASTSGNLWRRWEFNDGKLIAPSGGSGQLDIIVSKAKDGRTLEASVRGIAWSIP